MKKFHKSKWDYNPSRRVNPCLEKGYPARRVDPGWLLRSCIQLFTGIRASLCMTNCVNGSSHNIIIYNNNIQMHVYTGYFKPSIVKGLLKCLFVKRDKLVNLNYL